MWADTDGDATVGFADHLDGILSCHWPELRGRIVSAKAAHAVLPMDAEPGAFQDAVEAFSQRYPGGDRRATASLFAQWYLATSWPALITALLLTCRMPLAAASAIRLDPCGTPDGLTVRGAGQLVDVQSGLERLVRAHATPLMRGVVGYANMSSRVPWSNAINVLGWTLEQLPTIVAAAPLDEARALFTRRRLSDGSPNPLSMRQSPDWHRDGRPPRRTCCLRYRLAGVDYCGDCPVPATRRVSE